MVTVTTLIVVKSLCCAPVNYTIKKSNIFKSYIFSKMKKKVRFPNSPCGKWWDTDGR